MKTYVPKEGEIVKKWHVIDAKGKVLGRVAVEVAKLLRGKHKPTYTPFLDCGDNVIILNAEKAVVTGAKFQDKMYHRHSGYMGGLHSMNYETMVQKHPTRAMYLAVEGMLPHNSLGRKMMTHVRIYAGEEHTQEAQNPQPYTLD